MRTGEVRCDSDVSMMFPGVPVTFGVSFGSTPTVEFFSEVTPVCC